MDLPPVGRLGPSFSRLECPGGNGEAGGVPLSPWNKSLRPRPRFVGACSGTGERSVRVVATGSGALASFPGGSCTGVLSCRPVPWLDPVVATAWCRVYKGAAGGFLVWWRVELLCFLAALRQHERLQDQVYMHGVYPRPMHFHGLFDPVCSIPSFGMGGCCGSLQSLCAMVLSLIRVCVCYHRFLPAISSAETVSGVRLCRFGKHESSYGLTYNFSFL